ncbi:putative beta-Fructufuranosidase [Cadophora sp. MPI-SDFR-AT-0126]|nr:putative beta-Fructufuranosidase [Leotiomycetes sp. MPI-SDFR-AT-0126]
MGEHCPDECSESVHLFRRWRSKYHVQARRGWMNDPCAPFYDFRTKLYHLGFQWNPSGNDWGDIAWGHATSTDLVSWTMSPDTWLGPDKPYDQLGVFTGCMTDRSLEGGKDGKLTCFYTSVNSLPISWDINYTYGSETLSVATSQDAGMTWQKQDCNPILPGPPSQYEVTAWRDPFVSQWPALARHIGLSEEKTLFGIISGGIRNRTPTSFVYSLDSEDLTKWKFLGILTDVGLNTRSSRWGGDMGQNWEVSTFATITEEGQRPMDVLIMSSQGLKPSPLSPTAAGPSLIHSSTRQSRVQLWMSGTFQHPESGADRERVLMSHEFGGILDHGCYYAANSFWDPTIEKTVVFGWSAEDDLPDNLRHMQGWSGMLTLPRVLGIQTLRNVSKARNVSLSELTSFEKTLELDRSVTMRTLSVAPHPKLEPLRVKSKKQQLPDVRLLNGGSQALPLSHPSSQWEMECEVALDERCSNFEIRIAHSEYPSHYTCLCYKTADSSFVIDRSHIPTVDESVIIAPEIAPFALFTQYNAAEQNFEEETLRIRAFLDQSILEVFVNERVAITTRIYSRFETCTGLTIMASSGSERYDEIMADIHSVAIWSGLLED